MNELVYDAQRWASQAISRVESSACESWKKIFESSQVESSMPPSRVESSQDIVFPVI
jgi:hypothetical protein